MIGKKFLKLIIVLLISIPVFLVTLSSSARASAYGGTPWQIPGIIQAENYNTDGSGTSYNDTDSANNGGQYRNDRVDIENTSDIGGGYNVGWTHSGEWLKYDVYVTTTTTYDIKLRVANTGSGARAYIELDGVNISGTMTLPNTGGWQTWSTITKTNIPLTQGNHTLRLVISRNTTGSSYAGNYNYIEFTTQNPTPSPTPTPTPTITPSPTPSPSLTPNPSASPTPSPTNTPTPTVAPTPSPTITPDPSFFQGPLRVSAQNSRYFTDDSGEAILLSGTHTWENFQIFSAANPPQDNFSYSEYLDFLIANKLNYTRLWSWEQSMEPSGWPSNYSISPLPYLRTGPGNANDGQPKFDLLSFDQSYFDRLRQKAIEAGNKGIYVDVQLFNGWSLGVKNPGYPNPWSNHPFNFANNVNGINGDSNSDQEGFEVETLNNQQIVAIQEEYVKKVIDTVNDLNNVLYEITNESQGDAQSVAWQNHLIDFIHEYEQTKPKQHPVGFTIPYPNGNNSVLFASDADWISPNGTGGYMDNPPTSNGDKVIISDTDHLWGLGGDRSWVWKSFTRGLMATYMDCYTADSFGCPISQNDPDRIGLLKNLGYIRDYSDKMSLNSMTPQSLLSSTGYVLADTTSGNAQYLVYFASGGTNSVNLSANPGDIFDVEWLNPENGNITSSASVFGGSSTQFTPPFAGDAVLYLKQSGTQTPTPTPSPSPTPTPSPSPTPSPTSTPTPTPTPTPSPSPTPSPTPIPTPSPVPVSFPLTGILDDFDRENEGPPLSSNWDVIQHGHVIENQEVLGVNDADDNLSAWNTAFSAPVEAYLTIKSDPDDSVYSFYLLQGYQQIEEEDGYECWFDTRIGFDQLHITRVDDRVEAQLGGLINISSITTGDSVGCSIDNGVIRALWKPSGGTWTLLGEREDFTYQGPYYIIPETWKLGKFDDFGGGSIFPSSPTPTPSPSPTPSPTLTPTITPSPTPTPTPTPTPSPSPTPTPTPTATPSPSPTPTPTPTTSPSPSPTPSPTPSQPAGLVGHWRFDENTGTQAIDSSGNGHTGVITNPLWVAGRLNFALNMTANNKMEKITVADPANGDLDVNTTGDFTLSTWVKTTSFSESPLLIRKVAKLSETLPGYVLFVSSAGGSNAVTCQTYDDVGSTATDQVLTYTEGALTDGSWHQIVCSLDRDGSEFGSAGLRLFIDGALVSSDTTINSTGSLANSESLIIGESGTTQELGGAMDNVKIFNRALTLSEIQSDANTPF